MGIAVAILILLSPIVYIVSRSTTVVKVIASLLAWVGLYWFLGKVAVQQSGHPYHGTFIIISAVFFLIVALFKFAQRFGYKTYNSNRDDNDIYGDPIHSWFPGNFWR